VFNLNSASKFGGAIYFGGKNTTADSSAIILNNCTFARNNAGLYGGGLYLYGLNTTMDEQS
jgi:predicted outer membrane repeat protein